MKDACLLIPIWRVYSKGDAKADHFSEFRYATFKSIAHPNVVKAFEDISNTASYGVHFLTFVAKTSVCKLLISSPVFV